MNPKIKLKNRLAGRILITSIIIATLCMVNLNTSASISPDYWPWELGPGDCGTVKKTVVIPTMPPKVDIVFAFDLTNSMGSILDEAKTNLSQVMDQLDATGVDFTFGIVSYMDYPDTYTSCDDFTSKYGSGGDYPYSLDQPLTNDSTAVTTAINSLSLGNGWDLPEDHTRIFYESYADSSIGWRTGAKKLLVNFADSVPHDCNLSEGIHPITWPTGSDPGRDGIMGNEDDLDLQEVLAEMAAQSITLVECHRTNYAIEFWDYWTAITGGNANIIDATNFVTDVVNTITATITISTVYDLHLEVIDPEYSSWFSSTPSNHSEVPAGTNVTFNETICVPTNASPGPHTFVVSAVDGNGVSYGDQTNVIITNGPPEITNPVPKNGATGVGINPTLKVDVFDPDGDPMNVTFYDASDDSVIGTDTNVPSGGTASVPWSGRSYLSDYSWYVKVNDSEFTIKSTTWKFTTQNEPPPPSNPKSPNLNEDPIADASAGSPYHGFVGEEIILDGSLSYDPGGVIIVWYWDFGDGTTGNGETTPHIYSTSGTYNVTLIVTDNKGATDEDIVEVIILTPSYSPENLVVNGPLTGKKNIDYTYTASAIDQDTNDRLRYIFNWGDGTNTTSEVVKSGEVVTVTHNWSLYGAYEVIVTVIDNSSSQISTTITVQIDIIIIDGEGIKGYLVDEDSTDPFDVFDNTDTGEKTDVEKENDTYLIDSDGDGKWDYAYNPDTGLSTYLDYLYQKYFTIYQEEMSTPGFELISLLAMMAIVLIILRRKRNNS